MPVILDPDGYDAWLDPGMKDMDSASERLKPLDARLMRFIQSAFGSITWRMTTKNARGLWNLRRFSTVSSGKGL